MKAYEVNVSVIGGYKGQIKKVFVQANSIDEIKKCDNVLKVWLRKDVNPKDCNHSVYQNSIIRK